MPTARLRSLLSLLALLLISGVTDRSVFAQGTAEDYRRVPELRERWRGLAPNVDLTVEFDARGNLIAQIQEGPTWQFVRLSRTTGERTPAFDHAVIAEQLGAALEREIAAASLPIDRFWAGGDGLTILVGDRVFGISAENELTELALESIEDFVVPPTRAVRSRNGGRRMPLLFINGTDGEVKLDWLDTSGNPRSYGTIPAGGRTTQGTFSGHLWRVTDANGTELGRFRTPNTPGVVVLPAPKTEEADRDTPRRDRSPALSPDLRYRAFIRDHNVWLRDLDSSTSRAVTTDGTAGEPYLNRFRWSPTSTHVATIREKVAPMRTVHFVEARPDGDHNPKLHAFNYRKPGDEIDVPRVVILPLKGEEVTWDAKEIEHSWSLTRLEWTADGSELTFLDDARGHRRVQWLAMNAETGALRTIIDEAPPTFVDYAQKRYLQTIRGGTQAIWMSERSGWNHLWRIDVATGEVLGAITTGDWVVRNVIEVDDAREQIVFRACGPHADQDPVHIHVGRVSFDGGDVTWLTDGDGTHRITLSPDETTYLARYSRVDLPPVLEWRRVRDGSLIAEVSRGSTAALEEAGWRAPVRFTAPGRDGVTPIWGHIFFPSTDTGKGSLPVVENIYAGPHGQHVPKEFRTWHSSRALAELGFAVVQIDGMGTNWRSKAFHDVAWKNLGDGGFPDRIAWLKAAAKKYPALDLTRVGIYGGSAGGQNALRALLAHGDFYKVAVAISTVAARQLQIASRDSLSGRRRVTGQGE